jgi:hypothetical protein
MVMMNRMLEIPKDRKRVNVVKLCVLLGLTALLYLMIAREIGKITEVMTQMQ